VVALYVVTLLGNGTLQFSELHCAIEGITPRMLTVTLRTLQRDGLVTRTVYPVVPPRVDYDLTQTGGTLLEAVTPLVEWAGAYLADIDTARAEYDRPPIQEPQSSTHQHIARS
jgi:DNA-binding HxlR family transcriptional regulator